MSSEVKREAGGLTHYKKAPLPHEAQEARHSFPQNSRRARFRTKRQLWAYSGLALETHDSAEYRYLDGQLLRSRKPQQLRGLNQDHNHDLKSIFKGGAQKATVGTGPFRDVYDRLLMKGIKPSMARLTLARKIAAITLVVWKKGVRFDPEHLKMQAA